MRAMREDRDMRAMWEYIGAEFGKLYQWGRGGRTLAPEGLVKQHGGSSFSLREDYCAEMSIARVVEVLRIVESFNDAVESWCASVPEYWREHCADEDREELSAKRRAAYLKGIETRERNYWNARDVVTI